MYNQYDTNTQYENQFDIVTMRTELESNFDTSELAFLAFELDITEPLNGNHFVQVERLVKICREAKILQNLNDAIASQRPFANLKTLGESYKRVSTEMQTLYMWLNENFGTDDFANLCWELQVNTQQFSGLTEQARKVNALTRLKNEGRLEELRDFILSKRPNLRQGAPFNEQQEPRPKANFRQEARQPNVEVEKVRVDLQQITHELNTLFTGPELEVLAFELDVNFNADIGDGDHSRETNDFLATLQNNDYSRFGDPLVNLTTVIRAKRSNSTLKSLGENYIMAHTKRIKDNLTQNWSIKQLNRLLEITITTTPPGGVTVETLRRGTTKETRVIELIKIFLNKKPDGTDNIQILKNTIETLEGEQLRENNTVDVRKMAITLNSSTFSMSDIETLAFDLDLQDWGKYDGRDKRTKIQYLINTLESNNQLQNLNDAIIAKGVAPLLTSSGREFTLLDPDILTIKENLNKWTLKELDLMLERTITTTPPGGINLSQFRGDAQDKDIKVLETIRFYIKQNALLILQNHIRGFRPGQNQTRREAPRREEPRPEKQPTINQEIRVGDLIRVITQSKINKDELSRISAMIGIEYDDLTGESLTENYGQLVSDARNRTKLQDLVQAIHTIMPNIDLSDFGIEHIQKEVTKDEPIVELAVYSRWLPIKLKHNKTRNLYTKIIDNKLTLLEISLLAEFAGLDHLKIIGDTDTEIANSLLSNMNRHSKADQVLTALHIMKPRINLGDFGIQKDPERQIKPLSQSTTVTIDFHRSLNKAITTTAEVKTLFNKLGIPFDSLSGDNTITKLTHLVREVDRQTNHSRNEIVEAVEQMKRDQ